MSIAVERLSYLGARRSWASISRETGIPYRQLLNMRSAGVVVNKSHRAAIFNTYRRQAYTDLRATGLSVKEATRWRSKAPEPVQILQKTLGKKIDVLVKGAARVKLVAEGKAINNRNIRKYYDAIYDKIKQGIMRSPLEVEEIMEYPGL